MPKKNTLIWEENWVRIDKLHTFNLRIPEPEFLKLKVLANDSGMSMHQWIMDCLIESFDNALTGLKQKDKQELIDLGKEMVKDGRIKKPKKK